MKVKLTMDEYYRIFILREDVVYTGIEVEVPEALVLRFQKADAEFRAAEDELCEFYKKAKEVQ